MDYVAIVWLEGEGVKVFGTFGSSEEADAWLSERREQFTEALVAPYTGNTQL